jgi:glycosidase
MVPIRKKLGLVFMVILFSACNNIQDKNSIAPMESKNSDRYAPRPYVELIHPEWSKNATIYEVNLRQFTREGTFKAFETHLPRLKDMGIDILWLMPIHPIGEKNRKGSLGSYYSVKDYYGVNPEFGNMADFKALVEKVHNMGMYIIIDWVANHSAWDNPLVDEHPEWYTRAKDGNFQPTPWYDWDDIIDFDFNNQDFRKYMTEALKFWVRETGIDGFRCDVAGFIPIDFWENARKELDSIKPVFMLAEWESRDLHKRAFDMTYSWSLWEKMHGAAVGGKGIGSLIEYMAHDVNTFPKNAYRMTFTDNHDKNSWEGNQYSNFGEGLHAAMVLAGTVNGMPLVYSGQEAGLDRSLAFFEKDLIEWKENENYHIYKKLFELKHNNQALWNGKWGGEMVRIYNDRMDKVISFVREKYGDRVISVINFSSHPVTVTLNTENYRGKYRDLLNESDLLFTGKDTMELEAWGYHVYYQ